MISCSDAAKLISEYLDHELTTDSIGQIEEHIHKCKNCLGHVDFDKALRKVLKNKTVTEQLSPDVKALIQNKLKAL